MREILELQQEIMETIERQRMKVSRLLAERGLDDEEFIRENLILDRIIERYIELETLKEELLYQGD